jgi:hypothetical protein
MSTFEPGPTDEALAALTEASGDKIDEGQLVGKHPRDMPPEILSRYHGEKNP